MNSKQVDLAAKVLASYELFDWETLPETDSAGYRDRQAFRQIASAMLDAAHGSD